MKNVLKFSSLGAIALCLISASTVLADPITPTGTSFGTLASATFGGSGIPNNAVQIWTNGTITLGLTATQRFGNPALTNDGHGTFAATAGGDTLNSAPTFAKWNFDFYIAGLGQSQFVNLVLFYGGSDSMNGFQITSNYQDSWNLGMGFLTGSVAFDPNATGAYGFALEAWDGSGASFVELGQSSILVNVSNSSSVPEGGSTLLMLAGALSVGLFFRRRAVR